MLKQAVLFAIAASPAVACADTVTLAPASPGARAYTVEGTITDYRGDALVIDLGRGSPKSYASTRVEKIETTWPDGYETALEAIKQKDWPRAAQLLTAAARAEKRKWAERVILGELLRVELAAGRWKRAGGLLIALDKSDPTTPAWSLAPLPWFASDQVSQADARAWLDRREESARLLGAAWLLSTPSAGAARAELGSLSRSTRPQIALLAECQLWRTRLAQADDRQADRWARRIEALPPALAAGPQHLVAQAYLRQKRYDEAALATLEAPLSGRAPHRLSARGMVLAARATQAAGRREEARRLLEEVIADYVDTPQRSDAEAMLRKLAGGAGR